MAKRAVVEVYKRDARVSVPTGKASGGGIRGEVKEFTKASRAHLLFVSFNAHADWQSFLTLTYPGRYPRDGVEVKEHLHSFLAALRYYVQGETSCDVFKYLWALEWQQRGAPHFHILAESFVDHKWLAREWYGVVKSGDERHFRAGTSVESCNNEKSGAWYMVKHYGAKSKQKNVPDEYQNVGRMWAASRGLAVPVQVGEVDIETETGRVVVRTLRRFTERSAKARRVRPVIGREVDETTGEVVEVRRSRAVSRPYRLANIRGKRGAKSFTGFKSFGGAGIASRLLSGGVQ